MVTESLVAYGIDGCHRWVPTHANIALLSDGSAILLRMLKVVPILIA
jgi:hypothetical protein